MTTSPRAGPSAQAVETRGGKNAQTQRRDVYTSLQPIAMEKANRLAHLMIEEPHRFALHGDQQLISDGLEALKALFDFSVETEGPAIPAIAEVLRSVFPEEDAKVGTRSTGAKRKRKGGKAPSPPSSHRLFEPTPLSELVTDGMVDAQMWDQLELRSDKICTLLDTVIVTEEDGEAEDADDESDEASEDGALDELEKKARKRRSIAQDDDDEEEGGMAEEQMLHNLSELTDADLRALGIDPAQREMLESLSAQADEHDDGSEEEDDDGGEGYPGASDLSDDDELSGVIITEPLLTEAEQQKRKAAAEAEERRQLRSQRQMERMMQRMQEGADADVAENEDDDDDDDDDDEDDESYDDEEEDDDSDEEEKQDGEDESSVKSLLDNLDAPGSHTASPSKTVNGRRSAALDDGFFSIDQFNRDTDDYGDEGADLGDDIDLFTRLDDQEEQEQETPLYYSDFFAPPPNKDTIKRKLENDERAGAKEAGPAKKTGVRFNDSVSVLRIKARKSKEQSISGDLIELLQQSSSEGLNDEGEDDEDMDEVSSDSEDGQDDESEDDESEVDVDDDESDSEDFAEGHENITASAAMENNDVESDFVSEDGTSDIVAENETFSRVAGDLFADEESAEEERQTSKSSHQQRLSTLQQEIAKLERENVGKKDWTLMGEAGSRARPENSLLEQDVDFESNRKAMPVNTPETTQSLEDLIKKRILDNNFDDVQRRATLQPLDFIPSKMLELSDAKNPKSLGQVYEEELGGVADTQGARLDKELQKEHEEIDALYTRLEEQMDALSNAHYTPKAPKVAIRTLSDTATIALEESLPSTMNNGTRLAPEEVYDAGTHNAALEGVSSELTPAEKQKRHRQLRDEKRARNNHIAEHKRNVEIHREAFGQHRGGRFVGNATGGSGSGKAGGQRAAEEKEEALRRLMGNKGVSVVGKGGALANGTKKGQQTTSNGAGNASQYKL